MSSEPKIREWTVMFYLATDNPLAPGVISHLKAMKNAGYHPQVNVLAQFDPHGRNMPVHIFDVNRMEKLKNPNKVDIGFGPNDSWVRNMVIDRLWEKKGKDRITKAVKKNLRYTAPLPFKAMSKEQNPKESLTCFLDFCRTRYPARHYMLFLLGHGQVVGGDVFLYDENARRTRKGGSGPHSLLLKDLGQVLTDFNKQIDGEGELELIGFHACSMSGAEVAYELKNTANYMLAAQGPTYVGSWPYRQILIRLFNDLGVSPFTVDDLKVANGLIDRLKPGEGRDETSSFMREQLNGNGVGEHLDLHVCGQAPQPELVTEVADKFERVLSNPQLFAEFPPSAEKSPEITKLIARHKRHPINGEYLKWMNRQLLLGGMAEEPKTTYTKANIKNLLISIFKYCLFNSYDFQLAGYSCDLTLCDLRKVGTIREPIKNLVTALTDSLEAASTAGDPVIRDLLVLAHWQSQSFYEENYTDLYDFCFCLKARCAEARPSDEMVQCIADITTACDEVMQVLKRGSEEDQDGVIVRCEFCGPAYQYVHGLSVYFPWSEPIDNDTWKRQYRDFRFNDATRWRSFLKLYFKETMRAPQEDEQDPRDQCSVLEDLPRNLLELLEDMTTARIFNDDGQLKIGSKDPLGGGKSGSLDPTGSDCDCGSIKNYPTISHSRGNQKRFKGYRPMANMYRSFQRYFEKAKSKS